MGSSHDPGTVWMTTLLSRTPAASRADFALATRGSMIAAMRFQLGISQDAPRRTSIPPSMDNGNTQCASVVRLRLSWSFESGHDE